MATRKTGPVKPPTLDLEASKKVPNRATQKPSAAQKSNARTKVGTSKAASEKPATPSDKAPASRPSINWTFPVGVAAGALAGAVVAYLVAAIGLWPNQTDPEQDVQVSNTGALVAKLERQVGTLESTAQTRADELAALEKSLSENQVKIDTQLDALGESIAQLGLVIEQLPNPKEIDPAQLLQVEESLATQHRQQSALQAIIEAQDTRIDALASGADQGTATQITETLSATNATLGATQKALEELEKSIQGQFADLTSRIETTETNLDARAEIVRETSQSGRLPLVLSGMEDALNSGRAFNAELNALSANLSAITISPALLLAADQGLPTPQAIARDFTNIIPQILAAAPNDPAASWQDNLINQAKSVLALRPTGAVSGDSPEALVARTEAALGVPDFAGAADIINAMPQSMRDATGDLRAAINMQAEARQLLVELRANAIAGSAAQ